MESKYNRYVLVILTVICVVLIGVTSFSDDWLTPLRTGVGYILIPIQSGVNKVGVMIYEELADYTKLKTALDENRRMQQEIDRLSLEKKAKEKQLRTLGLFKFSEKKEVQAAIEQLEAQMEPKVKELKEITDRLKVLRTDLADKCLRLACDAVDEYCVEIYRPYAKQLIAGLGSEPLTRSEINAKLSSSLTALQISYMLKDNPFISRTKKVKADKKEYSAYYLG